MPDDSKFCPNCGHKSNHGNTADTNACLLWILSIETILAGFVILSLMTEF